MVSFDRCEASVLLPYQSLGSSRLNGLNPRSSLLDVLLEQYPRNLERLRGNQEWVLGNERSSRQRQTTKRS